MVLALALLTSTAVAAQLAPGTGTDTRQTFVVSGTVVNSATGEPISRALVRTNGIAARNAFTDSQGHFQFEGLPAGQVILTAQKPGYFSEQDAVGYGVRSIEVGADTGAQVVKLTPQSAIFGRVIDASGLPIEHISVRLTCRALQDGSNHWEPRGMIETDEDGHFRFANLMPGTYYLSVGPAQSEGQILAAGQKPTAGFPHLYYPGVSDLTSAAPIQLGPGQQTEADFSLSPVPVYHVSGTITGQGADRGVGLLVFTSSGDDLSLPASFNMELGTFSLDSMPAGTYILKAIANSDRQSLRAEQKITVASNLDNVHLTLAPAISIPIVVHMPPRAASSTSSPGIGRWSEDRPPISIALVPGQPNASETFSTLEQHDGRNAMVIQNVDPGTYSVRLMPQPPWYVQSASYGQTNVLYDDITVAPGQSYPLEIVLRDDSATLTVNVRGAGGAAETSSAVVIVPAAASKLRPRLLNGVTNAYTETGLAPGDYLVYAFNRIAGLEYANPDALEPYASQAAQVTLTANQKAQVTVDLIPSGKGE